MWMTINLHVFQCYERFTTPCRKLDLNQRKCELTDLQSAPFDRFGIPAKFSHFEKLE